MAYASKTKIWHTASLHVHKSSWMKILSNKKDTLAVKQNNYATKMVNAYIVYDLDAWQNNPLNNFK